MKKKHPFWSILMIWSIKTDLPLPLFLAYFPGFVLCALFVHNPSGILGYIAFLIVELWEIGVLSRAYAKISEIFLPILIMHPYLCTTCHTIDKVYMMIKPDAVISIQDSMLLGLRTLYISLALLAIIYRKIRSSHS